MNHQTFARLALSAFCCVQGIAQLAIDLKQTHASNPDWTGHARFHVVWQSVSVALLSFAGLYLLWANVLPQAASFCLVIVLECLSPIGFIVALLTRKMYGGTLSDPSGIPPARFNLYGKAYWIDMNLAAVLMGFAAAIVIVAIYLG